MIPFKDKLIVVGLLKDITKERDKLKAENERLRVIVLSVVKKEKMMSVLVEIIYDLYKERDQLKAENDRLRNALSSLYESCMRADIEGDLSELISGEILDAVQQVLKEVTK